MGYTYRVIEGKARFKRLTEEGLRLFQSMWSERYLYKEIEATLGISESLVKHYKTALGLASRSPSDAWTVEDEQFVANNYKTMTDAQIGARIGRTDKAICQKRKKIRCIKPHHSWSEEAKNLLRKLRAEGLSYTACALRLGVPRNAAIGQGHRLGLPKMVRVAPTPQQKLARKTLKQRQRRHGKQFRITLTRASSSTPKRRVNSGGPAPAPRNLSLLELQPNECHNIRERGYCGHPRWHDKTRYCEYCHNENHA